ncbi:MAG TPA: M48 family metallopeptidase [Isosphaeraceae bacterium]|nr:M48 family metallopeptidase [Isosphaeraceae bacterium]
MPLVLFYDRTIGFIRSAGIDCAAKRSDRVVRVFEIVGLLIERESISVDRRACLFLGPLFVGVLLLGGLPAPGETKGIQAERSREVQDDLNAASTIPQEPVQVPRPSEKALCYYRSGMWLWGFNQFWALLVPGLIAFSGLSARLRNLARRLGKSWFLTVGLYVLFYLAIVFLIDLPLSYYEEFVRQHAYGLSNQTAGKWLSDSLVRLAVEMTVGFAFTWVPYLLLDRAPRRWWQITTLLAIPFLLATALIKPIWIDPLYNKYGPMKNQALERSILALAHRAGIDGSRVFEVEMSVDTKTVNAYVTGLWGTKRIVLWDTLLARLDEQEVLVVMAHEMGHYVLGHVMRSILLSSTILLAGLFLVDRLGRRLVAKFSHLLKFEDLADIASVPLLLMLIELSTLLLGSVVMAYSRYQEHEADRFALDQTGANHAGAMAFVKLQQENLSNPYPGLVYRIFRGSHPTISERIQFFNTYRPTTHTILQQQQKSNAALGP